MDEDKNKYKETLLQSMKCSYKSYKNQVISLYKTTESWNQVLAAFDILDISLYEALIDYIEEIYKTKIKKKEQLIKTTGLSGSYSVKDRVNIDTNNIIISAQASKYWSALYKAIEDSLPYSELLKINPKNFGLPTEWKVINYEDYGNNKYTSIIASIFKYYIIDTTESRSLYLPSLRLISNEIHIPYSVMINAYLWQTNFVDNFKQVQ